ncbi:neprilysin-4-like [Teleopsis dalmanni]|uniref:neprilysin-4-like n=1 Tax=Teleopsis dalmanni TaxID=139649 RepID=UPI0018CF7614|nr:neprilysin-4-like [Teleopsis dalmanni]
MNRKQNIFHYFIILILFQQCCYALTLKSTYEDFQSEDARKIMRLAKSAEMRAYMQSDIDPCDNFYKYACGNWAKLNPARKDPRTGIFSVLSKAFIGRALRILQSPKHTTESDMERQVKYFYESCLNRKELRHNYKENLLSIMEEFGGMPALKGEQWNEDKFNWLEVVAKILRKYGKKIIIGVDISPDYMNNEVNRVYIGQNDNLVTSRASEYYDRLRIVRKIELSRLFNIKSDILSDTVEEMIEFEKKLASGMVDQQEGLGMEDKVNLQLLEEMTETYKPTLNYTHFVKTWLGYEYRLPVYEYVESYHRNLRKVIESTPKNVVANYIMWELLTDFRIDMDGTEEKHQTKCVEMTKRYFVKYMDYLVYRYVVKSNDKIVSDVEQMWLELKKTFESILKSDATKWMTESTRDKALEKLSAMTMEINNYEQENFDKDFGDLAIGTDNYFENVVNILERRGLNFRLKVQEPPKIDEPEVLSFSPAYVPELNKIYIPVSFLQPRYLWDNAYPAAIKYSTVGYIVAHELAHGFDDIVRKYDSKGNFNNWWDKNSTAAFQTRKECLRQQYGEYKYGGMLLEKINAQDENIADNVGIRIAYAAYQSWLLEHANSLELHEEALPHMNLTSRQMFFVGTAQVWCADIHQEFQHLLTTVDVHAPEEVRVMLMLSNFDQFSLEFKCRLGTRMHPYRKCVFYG